MSSKLKIHGIHKNHVEKGFDIYKVKQALLNAGYDIKIVEEQLSKVLEEDTKNKNKIKILKYSIAAIFLVAIICSVFYYFSIFDNNNAAYQINETRTEEITQKKI